MVFKNPKEGDRFLNVIAYLRTRKINMIWDIVLA